MRFINFPGHEDLSDMQNPCTTTATTCTKSFLESVAVYVCHYTVARGYSVDESPFCVVNIRWRLGWRSLFRADRRSVQNFFDEAYPFSYRPVGVIFRHQFVW